MAVALHQKLHQSGLLSFVSSYNGGCVVVFGTMINSDSSGGNLGSGEAQSAA